MWHCAERRWKSNLMSRRPTSSRSSRSNWRAVNLCKVIGNEPSWSARRRSTREERDQWWPSSWSVSSSPSQRLKPGRETSTDLPLERTMAFHHQLLFRHGKDGGEEKDSSRTRDWKSSYHHSRTLSSRERRERKREREEEVSSFVNVVQCVLLVRKSTSPFFPVFVVFLFSFLRRCSIYPI